MGHSVPNREPEGLDAPGRKGAGQGPAVGQGPSTSRLRCQRSCRPKCAGHRGRLLGMWPPHRCTHTPTPAPHQPRHICECRTCPAVVPALALGSWVSGPGGRGPGRSGCSWAPSSSRGNTLPHPGRRALTGHLYSAWAPQVPVIGAGAGPRGRFVFSGFCWREHARRPLLGACVSGASKPKSPFGGRGAPSTRVCGCAGQPPIPSPRHLHVR